MWIEHYGLENVLHIPVFWKITAVWSVSFNNFFPRTAGKKKKSDKADFFFHRGKFCPPGGFVNQQIKEQSPKWVYQYNDIHIFFYICILQGLN